MKITPVRTFYLGGCLSESKRIFGANYSHFFALSFFFLPLSVLLIINPTLSLSGNFFTVDQKPVLSHLFYILFVYILALCAISTITYSTYHGFSGKPVKFSDVLKSLTTSFFPLVTTAIIALIDLVVTSLTLLLFVGVIVVLGQNLGFVIDYKSIQLTWFSGVVGATLIGILVYSLLNWSLAFVVVVAESKCGFDALIRSSELMKGMKSTSMSLLVYFGVFLGCTVLVNSDGLHGLGSSSIYALLPLMIGTSLLMWFLLLSTAANTVLYMYCKAFHGELAANIADESAHGYINMPSDDEKVSHVVTVVAA